MAALFLCMMLMLIWVMVLAGVIWLYLKKVYTRFDECGVKHFTPVPLLGNMTRVTLRMDHYAEILEKLFNMYPEERFIGNFEFLSPVIVIRDLELIKKITVKDFDYFLDHRFQMDEDIDPIFGRTLFAMRGQKWKDMRSTLSPAFTSSKIRLMVPFMVEIGEQMLKSVKHRIESSGRDYIDLDSRDLMTRYANDVIASCAFGLKIDSHTEDDKFFRMGSAASSFNFLQVLIFFGYNSFPNFMQKLKLRILPEPINQFFNHLVLDTMKEREEKNIKRNDMIHLLMEAKKGQLTHEEKTQEVNAGFATVEESDVGKKQINRVWSDEDLIAQAVLFFIAGFDSISSLVVFLLYELAINPDVQEKLVEEIKQDWDKNNGKISYTSIQEMKYMDMVVSEVLRKWSAPVADRICTKDYNIGRPNKDATKDYIVRKGEGVVVPIYAIHRCPEYYPDPCKFDPERFSDENKHNIKPFTYIPFGLGPRNCIGSRFALCEMKVVIYLLLMQIVVCPSPKTRIPAKLAPESFNLRMKGGHWLRLKLRN